MSSADDPNDVLLVDGKGVVSRLAVGSRAVGEDVYQVASDVRLEAACVVRDGCLLVFESRASAAEEGDASRRERRHCAVALQRSAGGFRESDRCAFHTSDAAATELSLARVCVSRGRVFCALSGQKPVWALDVDAAGSLRAAGDVTCDAGVRDVSAIDAADETLLAACLADDTLRLFRAASATRLKLEPLARVTCHSPQRLLAIGGALLVAEYYEETDSYALWQWSTAGRSLRRVHLLVDAAHRMRANALAAAGGELLLWDGKRLRLLFIACALRL